MINKKGRLIIQGEKERESPGKRKRLIRVGISFLKKRIQLEKHGISKKKANYFNLIYSLYKLEPGNTISDHFLLNKTNRKTERVITSSDGHI
jgi:hypothetical protein